MKSFRFIAVVLCGWCCLCGSPARAGEFQEAAAAGDVDKVMVLLTARPELLNERHKGTTALHEAARKGHRTVVELLIASGAELNAPDISNLTPLRLAIAYRHPDVAALLKKHGAVESVKAVVATNAVPVAPVTPVVITPVPTNASRVITPVPPPQVVLTSAPPEMTPVIRPIHEAAKLDDLERIKVLVKSWPEVLEATDEKGYTPLHMAVLHGRMAAASLLLEFRANPNTRTRAGQAALHLAAQKGSLPVVLLLLTNRANVEVLNTLLETPLITAARASQLDVLLASAAPGAGAQAANIAALHVRQTAVMKALLDVRADVNARDDTGATALMVCALLGNEPGVELLIAHRAALGVVDKSEGATALHLAVARGHRGVVERLLAARAEVNLPDARGNTPLVYAMQTGRDDVATLLQQHGGRLPEQKPLTPMEHSLVEYFQSVEKVFQNGSAAEKRRAALGVVPARADVEKLFPRNATAAWIATEQMGQEIRAAFDRGVKPVESTAAIWRIIPVPASQKVQALQADRWLAPDVPIYGLVVNRKGAPDQYVEYCFVNQHWVPLPPLNRVFGK